MPVEIKTLAEWVQSGEEGMLSVLIPAHNEEGHLRGTLDSLCEALGAAEIRYEILVVNDNSTDGTERVLQTACAELSGVRYITNNPPNGYGFAVRAGLAAFRGEAVVVVMADGSDAPEDVVGFYRKLQEGYDCVFGSRFTRGGGTSDYPWPKLILNRLGNLMIEALFMLRYNDMTNAFKMYRRHVVAGMQPLLSCHFNLTVEMPLKAIIRGYSYAVVPNSWCNRSEGVSKFRIKEMGSRYLFIILYCLFERLLSQGDYRSDFEGAQDRLQVWPK